MMKQIILVLKCTLTLEVGMIVYKNHMASLTWYMNWMGMQDGKIQLMV